MIIESLRRLEGERFYDSWFRRIAQLFHFHTYRRYTHTSSYRRWTRKLFMHWCTPPEYFVEWSKSNVLPVHRALVSIPGMSQNVDLDLDPKNPYFEPSAHTTDDPLYFSVRVVPHWDVFHYICSENTPPSTSLLLSHSAPNTVCTKNQSSLHIPRHA